MIDGDFRRTSRRATRPGRRKRRRWVVPITSSASPNRRRQDLIELLRVESREDIGRAPGLHADERKRLSRDPSGTAVPAVCWLSRRLQEFRGPASRLCGLAPSSDAFDIVCFGGGEFKRAEVGAMRSLGLSPNGFASTPVTMPCWPRTTGRHRPSVYPSFYEGFGIPPLEAMSCDCPVVCSEGGSIPEIVGEAGECFDPHEPESMRLAIERVVFDDARRRQLLARGRDRIKSFSWTRCAQETFDVYRRVLSGER